MQYRLSDETIGQIAKLVQLAILTGTDVVDNMRLIRLTPGDSDKSSLEPTSEYLETFEANLQRLQDDIIKMSSGDEGNETG
jgi:hypothetical protein